MWVLTYGAVWIQNPIILMKLKLFLVFLGFGSLLWSCSGPSCLPLLRMARTFGSISYTPINIYNFITGKELYFSLKCFTLLIFTTNYSGWANRLAITHTMGIMTRPLKFWNRWLLKFQNIKNIFVEPPILDSS